MESRARLAVEIGLDAVNSSLTGLGLLPLGLNPDFQLSRVDPAGFPMYRLVKPNVVPMWLDFAYELVIAVGPFPEFFVEEVSAETHDRIATMCTRIFTSGARCQDRRWTATLMMRDPSGQPWGRAIYVYSSFERNEVGETWYGPYVSTSPLSGNQFV